MQETLITSSVAKGCSYNSGVDSKGDTVIELHFDYGNFTQVVAIDAGTARNIAAWLEDESLLEEDFDEQ